MMGLWEIDESKLSPIALVEHKFRTEYVQRVDRMPSRSQVTAAVYRTLFDVPFHNGDAAKGVPLGTYPIPKLQPDESYASRWLRSYITEDEMDELKESFDTDMRQYPPRTTGLHEIRGLVVERHWLRIEGRAHKTRVRRLEKAKRKKEFEAYMARVQERKVAHETKMRRAELMQKAEAKAAKRQASRGAKRLAVVLRDDMSSEEEGEVRAREPEAPAVVLGGGPGAKRRKITDDDHSD